MPFSHLCRKGIIHRHGEPTFQLWLNDEAKTDRPTGGRDAPHRFALLHGGSAETLRRVVRGDAHRYVSPRISSMYWPAQ